jgi:uncharacterized protein
MSTHDYTTQAGRDLAWALTSPSLMDHDRVVSGRSGQLDLARNQGLMSRLDQSGSPLHEAVRDRRSKRLGEYFEILLTTWLDELPPAHLIAANEQVFSGERTVGEFDLLFRRDGRVHHWELAVKFYLGHPGPSGSAGWYGPNPIDRLDKKWTKMLRRQLRLAEHKAARRTLSALGVDDEVEPRAFIKGYLFEPLDERHAVDHHPDANARGLRGWWVHHGRLADFADTLDPTGELRWMRLSRLRWLSPARRSDRDKLFDLDGLAGFLRASRPSLVAGLAEGEDGWREVTRGFVVPDRWPSRR